MRGRILEGESRAAWHSLNSACGHPPCCAFTMSKAAFFCPGCSWIIKRSLGCCFAVRPYSFCGDEDGGRRSFGAGVSQPPDAWTRKLLPSFFPPGSSMGLLGQRHSHRRACHPLRKKATRTGLPSAHPHSTPHRLLASGRGASHTTQHCSDSHGSLTCLTVTRCTSVVPEGKWGQRYPWFCSPEPGKAVTFLHVH
ncbi:similar to decapping enzyme Dcp1b (predicted), isoform CRA_b [Rattus norvegicus]|uniref:Similar to decapping enzyme Dcp1b (Predicted), isoform CRA_b n=1 Tax=Rattus norvegicus TaxID=10116 RepID=A6IL79_RAT|nr:similar to decapping enzyme Dcp1b (predicted), isoform CRA_b [Rattus norvegicus]